MRTFRGRGKAPCTLLTLLAAALSLPSTVQGVMIGTGTVAAVEPPPPSRVAVQRQLIALGVAGPQAAARANALNPEEIAALNDHLKQLPAGGDIVGVIAIGYLVLLFTDFVGYTDVYPSTEEL